MPHHVMILGCGRSGTSIFGELFESIPAYQYWSEPDYAFLKKVNYSKPSAVKVPHENEDFPADEGLSFPLQDWLAHVPKPKTIFWQVRHPLDTICSLRVGIARNWGHHPQPPDWQEWLQKPLLDRCAHHWLYINTVGFAQAAQVARISRYEDMLADKAAFVERLAAQLVWDQESLNHAKSWTDRVQNTRNAKYVEAKTSSVYSTLDHKVKVGRWRENLSLEEADRLWEQVAPVAEQFGYEYP
ncbi:MAG: hypothetical protein AB8H47_23015 [Bacteroidia bacterium]